MEPDAAADYVANLTPVEIRMLAEVEDVLLGRMKKRQPVDITRPKAEAHTLAEGDRRARRVKNRAKRQKRSQRPAGTEAWMPRAKRIGKMARRVEEKHPGLDGHKTAKKMLEAEKELIGVIERHVIDSRKVG